MQFFYNLISIPPRLQDFQGGAPAKDFLLEVEGGDQPILKDRVPGRYLNRSLRGVKRQGFQVFGLLGRCLDDKGARLDIVADDDAEVVREEIGRIKAFREFEVLVQDLDIDYPVQ